MSSLTNPRGIAENLQRSLLFLPPDFMSAHLCTTVQLFVNLTKRECRTRASRILFCSIRRANYAAICRNGTEDQREGMQTASIRYSPCLSKAGICHRGLIPLVREALADSGDVFRGWWPVRIAGVAMEYQIARRQRFLEFLFTERKCLIMVVWADDVENPRGCSWLSLTS
jgi:hypothetical protein